jgi:hypothetical protein
VSVLAANARVCPHSRLLAASENPLAQSQNRLCQAEAADGGRTRDLKLGKLALYQLSYHRAAVNITPPEQIARPQAL